MEDNTAKQDADLFHVEVSLGCTALLTFLQGYQLKQNSSQTKIIKEIMFLYSELDGKWGWMTFYISSVVSCLLGKVKN